MDPRRTIRCPRCQTADTDTVTDVPYVRCLGRSSTFGTKRLVGCNGCVKKQLAGEVGSGLVAVWSSLTSLLANSMYILWNSLRLPFIKANPDQVEELRWDLGITAEKVDLPRVAAALAAAMVAADGKVEDTEIETALELGPQLVLGFRPELFIESLENVSRLPSPHQLAGLLADQLDEPGKVALLKYLLSIAAADSNVHNKEVEVLRASAEAMRVPLPELPAI